MDTFVNGELVSAKRQIYHGDRVVIGGSHYFRVSNPDCPNRANSSAVDYQSAHQELWVQQEKRLRAEMEAKLMAELQIEEEKARHELSYREKLAQLECDQFRVQCSQEILDGEREMLAKTRLNESMFEYSAFEWMDRIRKMEKPTEEGLYETQLKVSGRRALSSNEFHSRPSFAGQRGHTAVPGPGHRLRFCANASRRRVRTVGGCRECD